MIKFIFPALVIFGPSLTFFPSIFSLANLTLIGMTLLFLVKCLVEKCNIQLYAYKDILSFFMIFLFLFAYGLLHVNMPRFDMDFELRLVKILVLTILIYLYYLSIYSRNSNFSYLDAVMISITMFVIVNSILIITTMSNPNLQIFFDGFIRNNTNIDQYSDQYLYRFRGISSGGGAALSYFHSLYFLFVPYLVNKYQLNKKITFLLILISIFVLFSILSLGRTGIFTSLFFMLWGWAFFLNWRKKISTIVFLLIFGVIVSEILPSLNLTEVFSKISEFSLQPFYILFGYKDIASSSTVTHLIEMFNFSSNETSLLFGDGTLANYQLENGRVSDMGVVRLTYELGVFVHILFLGLLTYLFLRIKTARVVISGLIITLLILQFKENFLFKVEIDKLIIFVYIASLLDQIGKYKKI
jgi:hypothetical protein